MNIIVNMFIKSFQEGGTMAVVSVLQNLYSTDKKMYKIALLGGKLFATALDPVIDKTKTKIDDAFVDGINEAIKTSAENNNIDLKIFDDFVAETLVKMEE